MQVSLVYFTFKIYFTKSFIRCLDNFFWSVGYPGRCECKFGYAKPSCSYCKFVCHKFKLISTIFQYYNLIIVKGCNSGGSLACQNKATCLPDGTCKCQNGYCGGRCSGKS
jgi:hypothetical protein